MSQAVVVGASSVKGFNDVSILPIFLIQNSQGSGVILRLEGHHIINQKIIETSGFLQALQDAQLWDGASFAQNGIALPENRVLSDGPSPHAGGHGAYNIFIQTVINSFNTKYGTLLVNFQNGQISEDALLQWLEDSAKTIKGLTAYLKAELSDPASLVALHGADIAGSGTSSPFWALMSSQWNGDNLTFKSDWNQSFDGTRLNSIANDPLYQLYKTADIDANFDFMNLTPWGTLGGVDISQYTNRNTFNSDITNGYKDTDMPRVSVDYLHGSDLTTSIDNTRQIARAAVNGEIDISDITSEYRFSFIADDFYRTDAAAFNLSEIDRAVVVANDLSRVHAFNAGIDRASPFIIGSVAFLLLAKTAQNAEANNISMEESASQLGLTDLDFYQGLAFGFLQEAAILGALGFVNPLFATGYLLYTTGDDLLTIKALLKETYPELYSSLGLDYVDDVVDGVGSIISPNIMNNYLGVSSGSLAGSHYRSYNEDGVEVSEYELPDFTIYREYYGDDGEVYRREFLNENGNIEVSEDIGYVGDAQQSTVTVYDDNGERIAAFVMADGGFSQQSLFHPDGTATVTYLSYSYLSGLTDVRQGTVNAEGEPIGEWKTTVVATNPETGATVAREATATPDGTIIGPWETKVYYHNTTGTQIGTIFGSTLGAVIAGDDVFAQIGAATVLGTALGNVVETIGNYLTWDISFDRAIEGAFEDFGADLYSNLQSQAVGALSSFLIAELSDELGIGDDFGGELLTSVAGRVTSTMIGNVLDAEAALFDGLAGGLATGVGSFLGSYLAHEVLEAETVSGAVGGSLGGALGTLFGPALLETIGVAGFIGSFGSAMLSAILLPGIGAFVGVLLGTILGDAIDDWIGDIWDDWFGNDPPRADAWVDYDPSVGEFVSDPTGWRQEGGPRDVAVDLAGVAAELLNAYVGAVDGQVINESSLRQSYRIWTDKDNMFRSGAGSWDSAEKLVEGTVLYTLRNLQIAGGDLYVKRALRNSTADNLQDLNGDLRIAQDYARYVENKDIIDLLIAVDPQSAFSAGWIVTLVRAQELGLTEWSEADFQGGFASFLKSFGIEKYGATPEDIAIAIEGTTLRLSIVVDDEEARVIEIEDFADRIGYQHLAAAADGSAVTGTEGNDIWIAGDVASSFVDAATATDGASNDILVGSAFADSIDAGAGWDFVRSEAGDDVIVGGAGNDSLHGGAGADAIHGDADNGFAPIPTETELSDGAVAGAPDAFDNARRTWVGGVEPAEPELSRGYTPPPQDFNEDEIHGGEGDDQLAGGAGDDILHGDGGADTLYGDAGNDLLSGGAGVDTIYGGAGLDTASYADSETGVTVDLAGAAWHGTASDGDTLHSIEDLIGSRLDDTLSGDAYSNMLDGGAGEDVLDGRGGRDTASFFTSAFGVEVDMGAGVAITTIPGTGEEDPDTVETDTLLNIEDVIGSRHDDRLIASSNGGRLDGEAGNDTFVLPNDDLDVAGGAGAYEVRGGDGIDTLDLSGWDKGRGVSLDLAGSALSGNVFDGIERIIGSSLDDYVTGGVLAEIFEGGSGNDLIDGAGGDDIYLLSRGDGHDVLASASRLDGLGITETLGYSQDIVNSVAYSGTIDLGDGQTIEVTGADNVQVRIDTVASYQLGHDEPEEDEEDEDGSDTVIFDEGVSYHDIYGGLSAIGGAGLDLSYDQYLLQDTQEIVTLSELLDLFADANLTIGIKEAGSYVATPGDLSALTDSFTISGYASEDDLPSSGTEFVGISDDYTLSQDGDIVATHSGSLYSVGLASDVERIGFENSGHIALGEVRYFLDGSAADNALTAAAGQATWLYGGELNDSLTGSELGDVLVGGSGDDLLSGGEGDDQYAYWLGDGHDIIADFAGTDVIVFGGGISSSDIELHVGKLDDPTDHTSFRDAADGEVPTDLRIEIYDPETGDLSGSISIIDFESTNNASDTLRFAGSYEVTIFELLVSRGDTRLPTLAGTTGDDTLTGGDEGEAFYGLNGSNILVGNDGDDVFFAHGGSGIIQGGAGTDTLDYRYAAGAVDVDLDGDDPDAYEAAGPDYSTDGLNYDLSSIENVTGSEFNDRLDGNSATNVLIGLGGNDLILADSGDDTLHGGDGDDTLDGGAGNDLIYTGHGNDTVDGGSGNDTLSYADSEAAVTVNLTTGVATSDFTEDDQTVTETDTIANIENVTGTTYDDTIVGGTVAGTYDGGSGDDTFILQNDDVDVAAGAAAVTLLGGLGHDTLDFSGWAKGRGIEVNLGNVVPDGGSNGELGDWFGEPPAETGEDVNLYNSIDTVVGSDLGDRVQGTERAETFIGGVGDDDLAGLGGADTLDGGAGIDTAHYTASEEGVTVDLAAGTGAGGDAEGDALIGIENVVGSAQGDTLVGDDNANVLSGGDGDDALHGGAGDDVLVGGEGSDVLDGGLGKDVADYREMSSGVIADLEAGYAIESPAGQLQSVTLSGLPAGATLSHGVDNGDGSWTLSAEEFLQLSITPPAGLETFELDVALKVVEETGVVMERAGVIEATVTDGVVATRLTSISARQTFEEGPSGWSLSTLTDGGEVFTRFLGRTGGQQSTGILRNFSLPGFAGAVTVAFDFYELDSWDDEQFIVLIDGVEVGREWFVTGGADDDHTHSVPLTSGLEDLGWDDDYADQIHRFSFASTVEGEALELRVRSWLSSSIGDESYGIDNVVITMQLPGDGDPQSQGELLGALLGGSTDYLLSIEDIDGTAFADALSGDAGANRLTGGVGDDTLTGRGGDDLLFGGEGDDRYVYNPGDGHDIIDDASGIDRLAFGEGIAAADVVLTIGKLDDPADPASFRAAVDGEFQLDLRIEILDPVTGEVTGSVTVIDFRAAGSAGDVVRFADGTEIAVLDLIQPLYLGTAGADTLTGGAAGETFVGLGGLNILVGNDGDDVFYAHGGSGSIQGGAGTDRLDYRYAAGAVDVDLDGDDPDAYEAAGPDYSTDGLNYDLSSIENVTGSEFNDRLDGNSAANVLIGRGGNDLIYGDSGNDTLDGGDGGDQLFGDSGDDLIYSGRGNDTVDGGSGNDTLSYADSEAAVAIDLAAGIATASFTEDGETVTETDTIANVENVTATAYDDTIVGGTVAGTYDGGEGDDTFVLQNDDVDVTAGAAAVTLLGGLGHDTLDFSGWTKERGIEVDLGNGGAGVNLYNSIDTVVGSDLDDRIDGTEGAETFTGGAGDDDLAGLGGADALDGGAGIDTAHYTASAEGVTVDLAAGTGAGGDAEGDTLTGIENVVGSAQGDTLVGGDNANVLSGGDGDDDLFGNAGDDVLVGGEGTDVLDGGLGKDVADYREMSSGIIADLEAGHAIESSAGQLQSVTLSGLPAGATLSHGIDNGDGTWTLTAEEFLQLSITPPASLETFELDVALKVVEETGVVMERAGVIEATVTDGVVATRLTSISARQTFEEGPSGWSLSTLTDGGGVFTRFLGRTGGEQSTGILRNFSLPGFAGEVALAFDFYELDSWDNESFTVLIDGVEAGREYFRHSEVDDDHTHSVPLTPDLEDLGFSSYEDQIHRFSFASTVEGEALELRVRSWLSDGLSNESYGIDNVVIAMQLPGDGDPQSQADLLAAMLGGSADRLIGIEDIDGTAFADALSGDAGANRLTGGAGDDTLTGRGGDDLLSGGEGDDRYVYNPGDGHDIIDDASGIDRLVFGDGISATDVVLTIGKLDDPAGPASFRAAVDGEFQLDLRIEILDPVTGEVTGSVTVIDFRAAGSAGDVVRFADGSEIAVLDLLASRGLSVQPLYLGTADADTLTGGAAGETFVGRGGSNILVGNDGDDVFYAHGGSGSIQGGAGTDTLDYRYAAGAVDVDLDGDDPDAYEAAGPDYSTDGLNYDLSSVENVTGSEFNDRLDGNSAANVLIGRGGNDLIYGDSGNDTLDGGDGDDLLGGGAGSDVYVYRSGDGSDTIDDDDSSSSVTDVLRLTDLNASDVTLRTDGTYLTVKVIATGEEIRVEDQFNSRGMERIEFADGTSWDSTAIQANAAVRGTESAETLNGFSTDDTMEGLGGNDTLNGNAGADTLIGGLGDDTMNGGVGGDTYLYALGDGSDLIDESVSSATDTDVLRFTNLNAADVTLRHSSDDLFIWINATSHEIKIGEHFYAPGYHYGVERIEFADGTSWDLAAITANAWYRGTASGETISGSNYDDVIFGDLGNDTLVGGNGSDVYVYRSGDGSDVINDDDSESGWTDVLRLPDLDASDVRLRRSGNDLYIRVNATGQEIRVAYQFSSTYRGIERIEFGDGTVWDLAAITANAWVRGTTGNDTVSGYSTNDTLFGDLGNDTLNGSSGDDIYVYRSGDGADIISETVNSTGDVLRLTDLNAADVELRTDGTHLYVRVVATGHEIRVTNHFAATNRGMEWIEFADGTFWDLAAIAANAAVRGTDNAETLNGFSTDDTMEGLGGNDTLNGNAGADTLIGGLGDDTMNGGVGGDTYLYALGDGSDLIDESVSSATDTDVLHFTNLNAADVTLRHSSDDLFITIDATGHEIRIDNHFYSPSAYYGVERIEFAYGTSWDFAAITANAWVKGTAGADELEGSDYDDVIFGDLGDDMLFGGVGSDVFVYRSGDGNDLIYDAYTESGQPDETDVLRLTDLNVSDVTLRRSGDDLVIQDNATGQEIVVAYHFFGAGAYYFGIERIEFAGGSSWDLAAIAANSWIRGTTGNDTVSGYSTNDMLFGDLGDDTLNGGSGDDIYVYRSGDGADIISETVNSTADVLRFTNLNAADVTLRTDGTHLYVRVVATGHEIRVTNHFAATNRGIEWIEFADGTSWDLAAIAANAAVRGTDNAETLNGFSTDDTMEGLGGNDTLNGNAGADILIGGLGDDTMNGGVGGDTYLYALGDGSDLIDESISSATDTDVLRFTNLNAADVTLRHSGADLFITIDATGHEIRIDNHFYSPSAYYGIERIEFADGTSWDFAAITANAWYRGTTDADELEGSDYDDVIFGDLGSDTLLGGEGDDTYIYRSGDGFDLIFDTGDSIGDTLRFLDLNASDVMLRLEPMIFSKDLIIKINATDDEILILGGTLAVEQIEFADGTTWDAALIDANVWTAGTDAADTMDGTSGDDRLHGLGGDDTLDGGAGDDTLNGGTGNDWLDGGAGNDTFVFYPGFGMDVIATFDDSAAGDDVIEISSSIFADFAAMQSASAQVGADVVITASATDSITLKNYDLVNLGADDFRFA